MSDYKKHILLLPFWGHFDSYCFLVVVFSVQIVANSLLQFSVHCE
jgi:hypothetical protein